MKKTSLEARELAQLSALLIVITLIAAIRENPRWSFMGVLTAFVLVLTFIARLRQRRGDRVQTIKGRGKRKKQTTA